VEEVISEMINRESPLRHVVYNLGSGVSRKVIDIADNIADSAGQFLRKNIPVVLPADAIATQAPDLTFSIGRLLEEEFCLSNDVDRELWHLLQFCAKNFKY
jgi:hypothetical protein